MFIKTLVIILMLIVRFFHAVQSSPILGEETEIDDRSIIQGRLKPIYSHCDDIGNHLNCMLFCKSLGHTSGNCAGDSTCTCI